MSRNAKDRILAIMSNTTAKTTVGTITREVNARFGKDYSQGQIALYCKSLVDDGVLVFEGCETGFRLNQADHPHLKRAIVRAQIGDLDAQPVF